MFPTKYGPLKRLMGKMWYISKITFTIFHPVFDFFFSLQVNGKATGQFLHSMKKIQSVDSFYLGHFKSFGRLFHALTTFQDYW